MNKRSVTLFFKILLNFMFWNFFYNLSHDETTTASVNYLSAATNDLHKNDALNLSASLRSEMLRSNILRDIP
jgi:hypothetical protein